jgi:hypothetical protein
MEGIHLLIFADLRAGNKRKLTEEQVAWYGVLAQHPVKGIPHILDLVRFHPASQRLIQKGSGKSFPDPRANSELLDFYCA